MRDEFEAAQRRQEFQQLQQRYLALLHAVTVLAEEFRERSTVVSRECAAKLQTVLKAHQDHP